MRPASKSYHPPEAEKRIQRWWEERGIYGKVKEKVKNKRPWYFLDGPPYASGSIHLGTAWNKILKDVFLRYWTMRGLNVRRQPGWDCHGLPIEVMVEERLGIRSKKDIERKIGVEKFIEECKRWALEHVRLMTEQFKRLGVWMDWDEPYLTLTNQYIESAWWTLKKAHEKGLLRKDLRVIHWCPRCETALAEHEVRGEYYEVKDPSLYAKFKLKGEEGYLLIWTTTPWTLPANLAVCVHPEFTYAKVKVGEEIYFLAEGTLPRVAKELGWEEYRILERREGKELEGLRYEHPLLEEVPKQREFVEHHRVICGEHVVLEEGTGCVHTAPGFGEEDFLVGGKYGLPVFSPVGPDGRFTEEAGKYAGLGVKEADPLVLEDLKKKGLLVKGGTVIHSYPHCWRCKTPLIFRATEQWFLKVSEIKPLLLEKNERVEWVPAWVRERYVNGVLSVGDWCLSRQRYWGIPLPLWICSSCGNSVLVGSLEELRKLTGEKGELDLHRSDLDKLKGKCRVCGGEMERVPDVLDVWFDSSIASWASLGFPQQKEAFERLWPSAFITEGEDQVTKWFYAQQVSSILAFGEIPYRRVLTHGFALDAQGRKMSKSLGNVIDPVEVAEEHGADVLRLYILSANPPWEDLKFNLTELKQVGRVLNVLWNVHVFATTYMALDSFDPSRHTLRSLFPHLLPEDKWMLSRVQGLVEEVTKALEGCEVHRAVRALLFFVLEDLSRWYVRAIRPRTWVEKEHPSKLAAYAVLYYSLERLLRLLAPFAPHLCEVMYADLRMGDSPESVHLLDWPLPEGELRDQRLERAMELARILTEEVAEARQKAGLKLRWPVAEVVVRLPEEELELLHGLEDFLRERFNCKRLLLLERGMERPQGDYSVVETENREVAVSRIFSPELRGEALARELVRRLQVMRKEMGLEMEERVEAELGMGEEDAKVLEPHLEYLKREVRIEGLRICRREEVGKEGHVKDWEIEGETFRLLLRRRG
ncbi:MAG: isoleucine--tRNA ligase [Hadesarchaea archaeon]|nr:MAG: isoleucine--tRNA ligase [Hadesarchaea archaeon]